MAIAMLSAYTVAFAGTNNPSATSGAAVSGAGSYAGDSDPVFLMRMPTSAANASLAFTVDPKESVSQSAPKNAIESDSTYGTVIFSTESGSTSPNMIYKNESEPLTVMSMSSVDVKVCMFATLTDTKMKLSTTSGFTGDDAKNHLYLGVQVATLSGGQATNSGGPLPIDALGAKNIATVPTVPGNFTVERGSDGAVTALVSGASTASDNAAKAAAITDDKWTGVQYTVIGYSNPNADWDVEGLKAPNLDIKWQVYTANEITYEIPDPTAPADGSYTAVLDKNIYRAGETVTIYVKPTSATAKLKTAKLKYIGLKATDGTMEKEIALTGTLVGTDVGGVITPTVVNGVYSATVKLPDSGMARYNSPAGTTITDYRAPTFELGVS